MSESNRAQGTDQGREAEAGSSATTPQLLFDFIRDVIYDAKNAKLKIEALAPEYQQLGQGLVYFTDMVLESREFADALGRGDLKTPIPGRDNELASSLKALHASLRHMTWQTQQVAKGDYKQRIDFMGEFSEAFNTMVEQLDARQRALEKEIEVSREKTRALQEAGNLVANITEKIPQVIVVLSDDGERMLYTNQAAQVAFMDDQKLLGSLRAIPCPAGESSMAREIVTCVGERDRHYEVQCYSLQWEEQNAIAYVVEDISDRQAQVRRLEKLANWDELTRLNNRHVGMATLQDWLEEGRTFALCFLDLDNLKYVNDTFGHLEGDRYIRRAADLIRSFEEGALACRLGGDEFMLLVPDGDRDSVTPKLEVLCQSLYEDGLKNRAYETSISYGVVEVRPGGGLSASAILSLADERMYSHKRRNKRQRGTAPVEVEKEI